MSEEIEIKLLQEIEELKREIKELKGEKISQIPIFNFSKIKISQLEKLFNIKQDIQNKTIFDNWFLNDIEIENDTAGFLTKLLNKTEPLMRYYKEEDLKIHFLTHLFARVDFTSYEFEFRDFYNEQLIYETDKFILSGEVDFVVSKGLIESKKPYFFIQEFKKGKENSDPEPQLLAEMICAVELNNYEKIKGAYIVGAIWNFVILERIEKHKYIYYVSNNFDSTKIEDLKAIYKNLLFVKYEILKIEGLKND